MAGNFEQYAHSASANDGGSGVGVLLEIARQLSLAQQQPNVGVDIVLFDGEDYGYDGEHTDAVAKAGTHSNATTDSWCLGSQYWSKNLVPAGYKADYGILLDMVGARGARFAREGLSRMYAGHVVNKVWTTASQLGYSSIFIPYDSDPITDDHQYVMQYAKIPMIDIIEYNINGTNYFGDYHHTHDDDMKLIDPITLKAVGQTVLQVIYSE
ncbi:MAG: M28 family peptidase [Moraxellaceae bacterium]|nr:MAG: M28 family peptidase [Moraxellaceae bacterium]